MKIKLFLSLFILFLSLAACSSNSEESEKSSSGGEITEQTEEGTVENKDIALSGQESKAEKADPVKSNKSDSSELKETSSRKVIYNAELELRVRNYTEIQEKLEAKAVSYGGYIVQSQTSRFENEQLSGTMVFRIPQKNFQAFLHDTEGIAEAVTNRNVSGQDVTEEFVDLESRLRSKKTVEARLLTFMEEAEKTEDLLKISADLAGIQEEIEQLEGRKKYLQNQTDYSTVTVSMKENNVLVPKIDQEDLNTWQKVKKQLAVNINVLLAFLSGIVVLVAGNLPILILAGLLSASFYIPWRKKKRKQDSSHTVNKE